MNRTETRSASGLQSTSERVLGTGAALPGVGCRWLSHFLALIVVFLRTGVTILGNARELKRGVMHHEPAVHLSKVHSNFRVIARAPQPFLSQRSTPRNFFSFKQQIMHSDLIGIAYVIPAPKQHQQIIIIARGVDARQNLVRLLLRGRIQSRSGT